MHSSRVCDDAGVRKPAVPPVAQKYSTYNMYNTYYLLMMINDYVSGSMYVFTVLYFLSLI